MRLIDRLIHRDGYWEGIASGAATLTTSYGSADREAILPQIAALAQSSHAVNGVVFAAIQARIMLLSEASFCFQRLTDRGTFTNADLRILQVPWPDGTSAELLARMELDVSLAGNAYIWNPPGDDRLVRLRPDWTTIISRIVEVPGGGRYRQVIGYWWEPPKGLETEGTGQFYPAGEVVHWAPLPDPQANFRGMSWLTPVLREVQADTGMTTYKTKYLDNAATPNLVLKYPQKLQPATIDSLRDRINARYGGVANAWKTLVLDQGADLLAMGNNLQQMDFTNVAALGAERILAAANVPGILVGLEALRGAGRGYEESLRRFADLWARPQWRSACGVLQKVVPDSTPLQEDGAPVRLWYDTSDIAALQDGEMTRSQATLVRAQGVLALNQTNRYDPQSIIDAVEAADLSLLKPAPQMPVGPGQPVQHMLGQTPPGATADPLPPAMPRLGVGATSPGDGGNGTRPTPRPTSARRNGYG